MRSKALLAFGIMVSLISMITGTLVVMLSLVTVSTGPATDLQRASWHRSGWLSLLSFAIGLSIAIYGGRKRPLPAK